VFCTSPSVLQPRATVTRSWPIDAANIGRYSLTQWLPPEKEWVCKGPLKLLEFRGRLKRAGVRFGILPGTLRGFSFCRHVTKERHQHQSNQRGFFGGPFLLEEALEAAPLIADERSRIQLWLSVLGEGVGWVSKRQHGDDAPFVHFKFGGGKP